MPTFTSGADTYTVSAAGTYDLDMLGGDDRLNVYGGTSVTAHLGDGNDLAVLKAAILNIFGDAGADKFDIWATNAVIDGGADNDTINVRGGSALTAHGGLGADRFNFYADSSGVTLYGDDGNDDFVGYNHNVSGTLYGGAGSDYFVQFRAGATLLGGLGNDIYRVTVGSAATIIENASEGTDAVQVARGYSFTLPDNVENISVQGFSGSVLISATLTGNGLNNHIAAHNNDETINGLDGNDSLGGKGGSDTLNGGNGNDYLDGGTGNDTINGGSGNDSLQGRTGDDAMSGGAGDDVYYLDSLSDLITENVGEGTDTVRVSVTGYTLAANLENGIVSSGVGGLTLTGNALNNVLSGNSGVDTLNGGDGDDTLKGGAGADTMVGGSGDDRYYVDSVSDVITENFAEGTDSVYSSSADYTLAFNVENGTIQLATGARLTGNVFANTLTGGDGSDQLFDDGGNDVLNGGAGVDYMQGGGSDDTYYVDNLSDLVVENALAGTDTVLAYVSGYTLANAVENGTLLVSGQLDGNSLNNVLSGTSGNDTLNGQSGNDTLSGGAGTDTLTGGAGSDSLDGGTGADAMSGGDGDDIYYVENVGDTVTDSGAFDNDTVHSYLANYTLGSAIESGSIELTSGATLTGNASGNSLVGNSGNDTLQGLSGNDSLVGGAGNDTLSAADGNDTLNGGAGDDTMTGGTGNDTYTVDSAGDIVDETGGDGFDGVYESLANYTLPSGVEYGNVVLTTGATLTGSADNNSLQGNAGADTLTGLGGDDVIFADDGNDTLSGGDGNDVLTGFVGADTMYGGTGADTFKYNGAGPGESTTASWDTIQDFTSGTDKVDLSGVDANAGVADDQAFGWVLFSTGAAGQAWTVWDGTYTHVYMDVNGGGADMRIDILGTVNTSTDFVW